jgi:hypothetical protein
MGFQTFSAISSSFVMNKYFTVCLLLFILLNNCFGQRRLMMLQKKNKNKNAYYEAGDVISFRIEGKKSKITGKILDLNDSIIVFRGYEVDVRKITALYVDEKTRWWLRYKIAQLALLGGVGYLVLDVVNNGELNKGTLIVGGAVIGAGLIAKLLISNQIKIRGRTRVRILKL